MRSAERKQRQWVVELNFGGYHIKRWAEKRRNLLGVPSRWPLFHSEAV